jgi:ABC-type nitrate/sulfonate/bicarbonate transport system permease component
MLEDQITTLPSTQPPPPPGSAPVPMPAAYTAEFQPDENRLWAPLRTRVTEQWPGILSLAFGLVAWEVAGHWMQFSFLPPVSSVLVRAVELIVTGQILGALTASLLSLLVGYVMAVIIGVVLGLLMGRYRTVEYLFDPYINAIMGAPKLALVPILYALFGLSRMVQIAIVFLSAFFVIVINAMRGMQTVDSSYVEMARAFGAREDQVFWKILLPASLPLTMAGVRVAMGRAVKGMVRGEMVITLFGLGALLRKFGSRFDAVSVFAVLLVVIAVALVCSFIVGRIEKRLLRWTEPAS